MKNYNLISKLVLPASKKNSIVNIKQGLSESEAERKFFEWVRVNAKEGMTYISPDGHLVDGTSFARARQLEKSVANITKPKMLNFLS